MKLGNIFKSAAVLGVLILGLAASANAATNPATTTINVSATVSAYCSVTADNIIFGTYTGAEIDSQSNIHVTCSSTSPYTVALDAGTTTNATVLTRQLRAGGTGPGVLAYGLFRDSARSLNWGVTTGGTTPDVASGNGTGSDQDIPVYSKLLAGTIPAPGSYSDVVTVSVAY